MVRELFAGKSVQIPLIKRGKKNYTIVLGQEYLSDSNLIGKIQPDLDLLLENQPYHDRPLLVGDKEKVLSQSKREQNIETTKPLSREHLTRQINGLLRIYSNSKGKFIRSHSARASLITDAYDATKNILTTKDLVGHKNIQSTETYVQSAFSEEEKKQILETVSKKRKDNIIAITEQSPENK